MIFVSSQKEYKRESILQCTDDADPGLVTFSTSCLAFQGRTNLLFHVSSDENMDSPCGFLVLQTFPDEKRERLPHINPVQGCANCRWCLKASGASGVCTKRVLCAAPGVLQSQCREYGPLVRSSGSRCNRVLPVWCKLADVLDLVRTSQATS